MRQLESPFQLFEQATESQEYELYEEDGDFVLNINVPGYDPDDIELAWDDGVLNVSAEQVDEERGRARTYHQRFRFPKDIEDDEIEASYNNGILEVTLPFEAGATVRGREIPIDS